MDCCARGLKAAAKMIEDKALIGPLEARYAGWKSAEGKAMLSGKRTLEEIAERVVKKGIEPAAAFRPAGTAREHRQPLRLSLKPANQRPGRRVTARAFSFQAG